jgi:hypothetical protein
VGAALANRNLGTHDAFHAFNTSRNMLLSAGELGAGMTSLDLAWLGLA